MGKYGVKSRAVFLDRDGVINQVIMRDGKAFSPRSRTEFIIIKNAIDTIGVLKNNGFRVIVVTNQPDIARSKLTQNDLDWMTKRIMSNTTIDEVIVCPHDDQDNCACRKPQPGMLLTAAKKWNIDLSKSYMIGDGWKDIQAGEMVGCQCILIDTAYNKDVDCERRVKTLSKAVEYILEHVDR